MTAQLVPTLHVRTAIEEVDLAIQGIDELRLQAGRSSLVRARDALQKADAQLTAALDKIAYNQVLPERLKQEKQEEPS